MSQDDVFHLTANEWLSLNYALAVLLSDGLNANQLNVVGNFLCAVGQNILLLQAWLGSCPNVNAIYYINNCQIQCAKHTAAEQELAALAEKITGLENQMEQIAQLSLAQHAQDKPYDDADGYGNQSEGQKYE